jgi:hypothetical protein
MQHSIRSYCFPRPASSVQFFLPSLLTVVSSRSASSYTANKDELKKNLKTNLFTVESLKQRKRDVRKRIKQRREQRENSTIEVDSSLMIARKRSKAHWNQVFDNLAAVNSISAITDLLGRLELMHQEKCETTRKNGMTSISSGSRLSTSLPENLLLNLLHKRGSKNISQNRILKQLLATDNKVFFDLKQYDSEIDQKSTISDKDVRTIMATRKRAIHSDFFWSNRDARIASQQTKTNRFCNKSKVVEIHKEKNESLLQLEAQNMLVHLKNNLPYENFKLLMAVFDAYAAGNKKHGDSACHSGHENDSQEKEEIPSQKINRAGRTWRKLGNVLFRCAGSHFHLISERLAVFFYLDIYENHGNDHSGVKNIVTQDSRFHSSIRNWKAERDRFVDIMNNVWTSLENAKVSELFRTRLLSENERTIKMQTSIRKTDEHRLRNRSYTKFEAIVNFDGEYTQSSENTVLIDNLPVDITESELRELYSRCGVLKDVLIFNQRPDLDLGPLSRTVLADSRKKGLSYSTAQRQKWQQPRTPVYALLSFANRASYNEAIDDSLRIFGVLIRKHNVRTICVNDLNKLFLDNIPDGISNKEMERILSTILAPNIVVTMSQGQNPLGIIGSCEVRFPSFEVALKAYEKIQESKKVKSIENHDFLQCSVNWLRTRPDAELWWSKQLDFD